MYDLFKDKMPLNVSKHKQVQGVGGSKIQVLGQNNFQFTIESETFKQTFHVLESMSHSLILGEDFLKQHKAVIDYAEMSLRFPSVNVHFLKEVEARSKSILVRSNENLEIPAKSEFIIKLKMKSPKYQTNGLLEPIHSLGSKQSLIGARCVLSSTNPTRFTESLTPTTHLLNKEKSTCGPFSPNQR